MLLKLLHTAFIEVVEAIEAAYDTEHWRIPAKIMNGIRELLRSSFPEDVINELESNMKHCNDAHQKYQYIQSQNDYDTFFNE